MDAEGRALAAILTLLDLHEGRRYSSHALSALFPVLRLKQAEERERYLLTTTATTTTFRVPEAVTTERHERFTCRGRVGGRGKGAQRRDWSTPRLLRGGRSDAVREPPRCTPRTAPAATSTSCERTRRTIGLQVSPPSRS